MNRDAALTAFDRVVAEDGTTVAALAAAAEVMEMSVLDAVNTLSAEGHVAWTFVRKNSYKNKECMWLLRTS